MQRSSRLTKCALVGRRATGNLEVVPPPGTARATIQISHATGVAGDIVYLDDIVLADRF